MKIVTRLLKKQTNRVTNKFIMYTVHHKFFIFLLEQTNISRGRKKERWRRKQSSSSFQFHPQVIFSSILISPSGSSIWTSGSTPSASSTCIHPLALTLPSSPDLSSLHSPESASTTFPPSTILRQWISTKEPPKLTLYSS